MPDNIKKKHRRFLPVGSFFMIACVLLSGCMGPAALSDRPVAYNTRQEWVHSWGQYTVAFDVYERSFKRTENMTGETIDLLRSPFCSGRDVCDSFFALDDSVYVVQHTIPEEEHRRFDSAVAQVTVSLIEVDVTDLRENTVFETVFWMDNREGARRSQWEFLSAMDIHYFFLNSRFLFVLSGDAIRQVDFATHGITRLPVPISASNIAFDGRSIYYLDEDSRLFTYDTETGDAAAFSDIAARDFFLTEGRIYYLDRRDRDTLYAYDMDAGTTWKLADIPANSIRLEGESIYFRAREERTGYLINPDGTGLRLAGEV